MSKHFNLFALLALITLLNSCAGSSRITDSDFETLQFEIEELNSPNSGYSMVVSGFSEDESSLYTAVHKKLRHYYPKQVLDVIESDQNGSPTLTALIVDDPKSVNRVLWLFGIDTYREYHLEFEPEASTSGYAILTQMPELIGSMDDLQKKVKFPDELKGSGVEGQVELQFIVNEFGEVTQPEVITSLHESADREAIRVVKKANYKPALSDGLPVRVQIKMPIFFRYR